MKSYNGKMPVKTIKIAVRLSPDQETQFRAAQEQLTWVWNYGLSCELGNHSTTWYKWAEKMLKAKSKEWLRWMDWSEKEECPALDLDNIIKTQLFFGKNAFLGATCKIATGGGYFKIDHEAVADIEIKKGDSITYRKPYKWTEGDKPYKRIPVEQHQPRDGFDSISKLGTKGLLNEVREAQGLEPLTLPTQYIRGTLKQLSAALDAWKDPKLPDRKKPFFKRDGELVSSIFNCDREFAEAHDDNTISIPQFRLEIADKNAIKRLSLDTHETRTSTFVKLPSGYYLNVTIADKHQAQIPTLTKRSQAARKEHGEDSDQYLAAAELLDDARSKSQELTRCKLPIHKAGIDPGVNAVIAGDQGELFRPSLTRERISVHIERLQSKLDKIRELNNKKWKMEGRKDKRPKTKNELKLEAKIARAHEKGANNTKHFNHKLSTRLARTYGAIAWEDTSLLKMVKQAEAIPDPEGTGYLPNGATQKRGLNWSIRQRSLGDLKAKVVMKLKLTGGAFYNAKPEYSTQECHCCKKIGNVIGQPLFICQNSLCKLFDVEQNADVNAAKRFKQEAGFTLEEKPDKYNIKKLNYFRPKRYKSRKR